MRGLNRLGYGCVAIVRSIGEEYNITICVFMGKLPLILHACREASNNIVWISVRMCP